MYQRILGGILCIIGSITASTCVCTTVPCPISGENYITMGNGTANIIYNYELHDEYQVVTSAHGTILPTDLDYGTGTTSCTQKYSRMLDDEMQDCDAGHILAHRLGGYGNQPLNIFPQDASINRGAYAQFESHIYDCMLNGTTTMGNFKWEFNYKNNTVTKPETINYSVSFDGGNCDALSSTFTN